MMVTVAGRITVDRIRMVLILKEECKGFKDFLTNKGTVGERQMKRIS